VRYIPTIKHSEYWGEFLIVQTLTCVISLTLSIPDPKDQALDFRSILKHR